MPDPGATDLRDPVRGDGPGAEGAGRFSVDTRDLPPAIRLDAWRAFWQPAVHVTARCDGAEGFIGQATLRRLGRHVLLDMQAAPANYRRPRSQGLRDGLDHWVVALHIGETERPTAAIWLGSLSQGIGLRDLGGRWLAVFIQPQCLPQLASVFAAPRAVPVLSPAARMLAGMLPRITASADQFAAREAPRLEAALSSMLAACLLDDEMQPTSGRLQLEAARRARVIALVDAALGDPELSPAKLVRQTGLSRSELYRCFAPTGGVSRVIQLRRLRRAYAELARADGPSSISLIKDAVGFFDASSFTRAFRREFGCTPREVLARRPPPAAHPCPGLAAALSPR
ncbi:helix-turn-helix transcriptional regulator [Roseomonas frigidaquae]|uniref:Helix-turn-helix transcriptional regulator n=1 Tax=Falsiroseomonas frigidaquae TaxID=487318 RepID=A0ABX1ETQ1_9PROT|nr:AraC family transcriptional regulator [Falsiroseomonas frigidaquae]NKE44005.1 helix-turn-helix transcriptional regulator [Falsiroseomonas frigidaquae]